MTASNRPAAIRGGGPRFANRLGVGTAATAQTAEKPETLRCPAIQTVSFSDKFLIEALPATRDCQRTNAGGRQARVIATARFFNEIYTATCAAPFNDAVAPGLYE